MKNENKKFINVAPKVLVILAILLMAVAVPCYAYFSHETILDSFIDFGKIESGDTQLETEFETSFNFLQNGETKEISLKFTNNSAMNFSYYYRLETIGGTGLENAVMVHFNDTFYGNLAAVSSALSDGKIGKDKFASGKIGDAAAGFILDKLSFTLHNGANSYYAGKSFKVRISLYAFTADVQKYAFIQDADMLEKAVTDVNRSSDYKTLILADSIALKKDIVIKKACGLDFNGFMPTFNGYSIYLQGDTEFGIARLFSSRISAAAAADASIILYGGGVMLDVDNSAEMYADKISVQNFDAASAESMLKKQALEAIGYGVTEGKTIDLFGGNKFYVNDGHLTVTPDAADYNYGGGLLTANALESTKVASITIGAGVLEFKIFPTGNEAVFNQIIQTELQYLTQLGDVSYNLYLPTKIVKYNAMIEWRSSNPAVMSDAGECYEKEDGEVTMTAAITVGGQTFTHDFTFFVLKQDNQMRFDYLVTRIGTKTLENVYNSALPNNSNKSYFDYPVVKKDDPSDYRILFTGNKDLGLIELSYEIDQLYYFLALTDEVRDVPLSKRNRVYLKDATFVAYAEVNIYGIFKNDTEVYSGKLGVMLQLGQSPALLTKVAEYVQGEVSKVSVLENILATRKTLGMKNERGDFSLPLEYNGFDITYEINGTQVASIVDGYTVEVHNRYLPVKESYISIDAKIKFRELEVEPALRKIYFKVPAALHNDADGILDNNLFNNIKLQVVSSLTDKGGVPDLTLADKYTMSDFGEGYILLHDIELCQELNLRNNVGGVTRNFTSAFGGVDMFLSDKGAYYFTFPALGEDFKWLKNFSGLTSLNISGKEDLSVFNKADSSLTAEQIADNAAAFLAVVNGNLSLLERLEMRFSSVTDLSAILGIGKNLRYLDIGDNTEFSNLSPLLNFNHSILKFLDISNTAVNMAYDEPLIHNIYNAYSASSGSLPEYYYTDAGVRKLYVPLDNADYNSALKALYYLKDIDTMTNIYYLLPPQIIIAAGQSLNVSWELVSSTVSAEAFKVEQNFATVGGLSLARLVKAESASGYAVVSASVTVNGTTAKRYFKISLLAMLTPKI